MASVLDWTSYDVRDDLRVILQSQGSADPADEELKALARRFLTEQVAEWVPGQRLTTEQAVSVGRAFEGWTSKARANLKRRGGGLT